MKLPQLSHLDSEVSYIKAVFESNIDLVDVLLLYLTSKQVPPPFWKRNCVR